MKNCKEKNGERRFRTAVDLRQQIYSLPPLATRASHQKKNSRQAIDQSNLPNHHLTEATNICLQQTPPEGKTSHSATPPERSDQSFAGGKLPEGKKWSGRRGSNPRPSAWKADALPSELLPPIR
jgi:hypothetical protein